MASSQPRRVTRARLAKLCSEFLMLVLHIRRTEAPGDPEMLKQNVRRLLSKIEETCKKSGVSFERYQHAKYALIAFLDETVSVVNWSQYETWKANPMQMETYGRFDAGEQFFQRLDYLRKDIDKFAEVIEVYYLCLTLGFKGKYEFVGRDKLAVLVDGVYRELKHAYPHGVTRLSPGGYPAETIAETVKRDIPVWVFAAFAGVIGLVFYIIMSLLISGSAGTVAELASR